MVSNDINIIVMAMCNDIKWRNIWIICLKSINNDNNVVMWCKDNVKMIIILMKSNACSKWYQ